MQNGLGADVAAFPPGPILSHRLQETAAAGSGWAAGLPRRGRGRQWTPHLTWPQGGGGTRAPGFVSNAQLATAISLWEALLIVNLFKKLCHLDQIQFPELNESAPLGVS